MHDLVPWIWAAGVLQALIAFANLPAIWLFGYRDAVRAMPAHIAEVFIVQNIFIVWTVLGIALLCLIQANQLVGGSLLGRGLCAWLSLFWGSVLAFKYFIMTVD